MFLIKMFLIKYNLIFFILKYEYFIELLTFKKFSNILFNNLKNKNFLKILILFC